MRRRKWAFRFARCRTRWAKAARIRARCGAFVGWVPHPFRAFCGKSGKPYRMVSWAFSLLTHIEQAEARQAVVNQQLLLHKLMFYLAQLHSAHAAAVGSKFTIRMLIELDQQIFWSRCSE